MSTNFKNNFRYQISLESFHFSADISEKVIAYTPVALNIITVYCLYYERDILTTFTLMIEAQQFFETFARECFSYDTQKFLCHC